MNPYAPPTEKSQTPARLDDGGTAVALVLRLNALVIVGAVGFIVMQSTLSPSWLIVFALLGCYVLLSLLLGLRNFFRVRSS